MEIAPQTIRLRDGRLCVLRSARPEDAAAVLRLLRATAAETEFLARGPEDPLMDEADERRFLAGRLTAADEFLLAAEVGGEIAGSAGIDRVSQLAKFHHRAAMGVALRQDYWGLGIGSAMMRQLAVQAKAAGYTRLELEVAVENERAVALYRRFGFEIYGTRPEAFRYRDGRFGADHLMTRKL